ncbi:MAG: HlyD family efflux transporter periplasmic adaptor subunit [Bryobacteraceae bacterium]|nr:HlyD family efflux transporter periplasmic adaptor subunit [Bryobacteraceae bacterium]
MKRILPVLILLAAAGGYYAWSRIRTEDDGLLRLSGNIEFKKVDIAFKTAGKLAELNVEEGATVEQGKLLARLDREQISRMRERDSATIQSAESQYLQLQTTIRYQKEVTASETTVRESELRQAKAKLQELLDGARPQELAQARSALDDLRTLRAQASKELDRAKQLIAKEDISQNQFDQYQTRVASLNAQVASAEQRLALLTEGPRKTDIEAARAAVARTEAALRMTEAQKLEIQRREEDLSARRADVARAKSGVSVIDSQLDDTVAVAPIGGVVLVKSADPGEVLAAGTPILTLGDIDHPWLRGYVPQSKLGLVKLGMPVSIHSDSYPNKTYRGRISFIASEAEFTPKQIQTTEERVKLVYRIKVEVENPGRELKLNMPVDGVIDLKR